MDSFRNFLLIITTLGAIIFSFSKFFINLMYEYITQDFELGIRETRNKHVVFSICIFFIISLYTLILYTIFIGIVNQTGNEVQKQNITSWVIFVLMTSSIFSIILVGSYIKSKIHIILCGKKNGLFRFFKLLLILSFIMSILGLILSEGAITFEDSEVTQKSIETRIYKDGVFIATINANREFKIKDEDNASILFNNIVVGSKFISKDEVNLIKSNYLIISNDRKFNIKVVENIEPIKGDKITLKINNEQIGSTIFQASDSSKEIQYIIEFISLIIVFYPLSMASLGLVFSLGKLMSIRTTFIRLNSGSVMGKIVVKYDDFYVVYIGEQYEYIAKSRIISIVPKQDKLLK